MQRPRDESSAETPQRHTSDQDAIKKLRDLARELDAARRSQRAATTELTKTKKDSARHLSRKTPPR